MQLELGRKVDIRRTLRLLATGLALFGTLYALGCGSAPTEPAASLINGTVVDANGHAIAGASIAIGYPMPTSNTLALGSGEKDRTVPLLPTDVPIGTPGPIIRFFNVRNNPLTAGNCTFDFGLAKNGHVTLQIVSRHGEEMRLLADRDFAAGRHTLTWDGTLATGAFLPADVYDARLKDQEGDSTFSYSANVLVNIHDPALARIATTDSNGRFSIAVADLPIGQVVHCTDDQGVAAGDYKLPTTVDLYGQYASAGGELNGSQSGVSLAKGARIVRVTLTLR